VGDSEKSRSQVSSEYRVFTDLYTAHPTAGAEGFLARQVINIARTSVEGIEKSPVSAEHLL
jgi:hypothetical protein